MRENPYNRLKRISREWASKVEYPHTRLMFRLPKAKTNRYTWGDIFERVKAAEQLGYHVRLESDGPEDLRLLYVKNAPDMPMEIQF